MRDRRTLLHAVSSGSRPFVGLVVLTATLLATVAFARVLAPTFKAHGAAARSAQLTEHPPPAAASVAPRLEEDLRVSLGRKLFFDRSLSEPAGTSCASCHDPRQGYAGNNGSTLGTAQGSRPGHFARRNTPSVMYLRFVRKPHLVWEEDADRPELFGGFFWDGRASTIAALVREPLLNPDEMGNRDLREVARKIESAAYAKQLEREFDHVFASDDETLEAISLCIEAFLTSRSMSPFSSKYDDFIRGSASLSAVELRGLALFEDLDKGACSTCHRIDRQSGLPEASMFTDYGYDVVAVPRNRKLPGNADTHYFDLGVCDRSDRRFHTEDPWFCGAFRTPSLRNVALRTSFMHNGVFTTLRDVVSFYATRATTSERWYPTESFDDLPAVYRANVNVDLPPYNQVKRERPRLEDADLDAILAFLATLSDRSVPPAP
jgi:cytochrome c peroxidase